MARSDVLEVEALAMRTGISGDEALALIDRVGSRGSRASRAQPQGQKAAKP
ncbi:hypothetical protein NKJ90_10475 [Mesorhizobium sp. M0051]|uniref:hypothetical protein n=1 Tax=unclassified Mesorhizobium TaxID=325217 RepID=UPI0003CF7E01|nr:hypothetical protein [Mesorhizobium sp. LNHC252B00]ESY72041.1 hypothetical protein X743_18560 [Mesorhizobium sp. LNHC252B00]